MKKNNNKLILDYINGNDIVGYDIEELENDYNFMTEVIKLTNDKNMYNLCSNELKNNYEFIKFIVLTFQKDIEFICEVANNYLSKIDKEDITYKELVVLMGSLAKNINNFDLFCYSTKAFAFYIEDKIETEICLQHEKDKCFLKQFGMGFLVVLEEYGSSQIITDFFAKKYIGEIFYKNEYSFEELIHLDCKKFDMIEKIGINNYIINYIRRYDSNLANYLCCHLDNLNTIKKDLELVKSNWNNYMNNLNGNRLDIIYEHVNKYIEEQKTYCFISCFDIVETAMKKLNLLEYFKLEEYNYELEDSIKKDNNINLLELRCIEFTIKLILELLKKDVIDKKYDQYIEAMKEEKFIINKKAKILDFKANKL